MSSGRQRRHAALLAHEEAFLVSRWNHRLTSKAFRQTTSWDEVIDEDAVHDCILAQHVQPIANQPSLTLEANSVLAESLQPGNSVPAVAATDPEAWPSTQTDEAVRECFDLGTLVRQALARYMDEKNEKALGQAVAEWVAISRQPSVVSLSSESDIQDAIHAFVEHQQNSAAAGASGPPTGPELPASHSPTQLPKVQPARADSIDDFVLV